ncbi:CdiA family toxin C-terminal domain-containing protein [Paenibacillus sp. DYY-L-2]|uniref:CdiA family toxin C-terminal domain-containing protein n=1 Tax=Paenibacillus sp. DYY-L-2 TaxID=3447013 RepID=UPI003F501540
MKIEVDANSLKQTGRTLNSTAQSIDQIRDTLRRAMGNLTMESRSRPDVDGMYRQIDQRLGELEQNLAQWSGFAIRKAEQFTTDDAAGKRIESNAGWDWLKIIGKALDFLPVIGIKGVIEGLGRYVIGTAEGIRLLGMADESPGDVRFAARQTNGENQPDSVVLLAGRGGDVAGSVQLASQKEPGEPNINETNLAMLLELYENERGYSLFRGEVVYRDMAMEHVPLFLKFALDKGYDPDTFEYLEFRDRSEAYRRMEETISGLQEAHQAYKESLLDGYETLAFGRGLYMGLENSVNKTANQFVEIVSHPLESGKAALQGIKQIYIDLNEEARKFAADPVGYIKQTATDKWNDYAGLYAELESLEPSQRWERIGGIIGENMLAVAASLIGGGVAGQAVKKVSIVVGSKIDVDVPIKDKVPDKRKESSSESNEDERGDEGTGKPVPKHNYSANSKNHLIKPEGVNKTGVSGGHNAKEFFDYLDANGIPYKVENKVPHPSVSGVYDVYYKIAKQDRGVYTSEFKASTHKKTVYDETVFTDEQMYKYCQEAMDNGTEYLTRGGQQVIQGTASNGLKFEGWKNPTTGEIESVYPVLEWKNYGN